MPLVTCMTGLVSRPASKALLKSVIDWWRSVCSRPGRARVSVPLVNDQTAIQTTTTPSAGIHRLMPESSTTGGGAPGSTGRFSVVPGTLS